MKLEVFNSSEDALRSLTEQLMEAMEKHRKDPFHLALSGSSTAQLLFKIWVEEYREKIRWEILRFYWVDERCVAPDDEESNYKHAEEMLFHPLNIPASHIHRIFGEREPEVEAERYADQIKWELPGCAKMPCFDGIILGMGTDGHTASIFPSRDDLLTDPRCYATSEHPVTGQKRVTMTGTLILNSKRIWMPVLGASKALILQKVLNEKEQQILPAAYILRHATHITLFTDVNLE